VEEQKTPEQRLAEQQARQEISRRYVDPRANDPEYQDLVDRNRIPSGEQVAPKSALRVEATVAEQLSLSAAARTGLEDWVRKNPIGGMVAAAAAGFVLALMLGR
jgi:hypothetical protein